MNKTKKQTHIYREQTTAYQWGEGQYKGRGIESTHYRVQDRLNVLYNRGNITNIQNQYNNCKWKVTSKIVLNF